MIRKSMVRIRLIVLVIFAFCIFESVVAQRRDTQLQKTVVIDPGHGGKDPGTAVGKAREKDIVLDIALKLGRLVRQNQNNIKVVFTRDGDYFIPLMDRAQIANKIHADLFISVHANYCGSPEINGTETYVLGLHRTEDNLNVAKKENSVILLEENYSRRYEGFNPNLSESYIMFELIQGTYLDQSLRFASILQSNFKELAQRHDREVRQAGFLVLRETSMPSVLIETGYLSNKKENSFLLTEDGRSEIAQSIYGSLVNYLNKIDSKDNLVMDTISDGKKTSSQTKKGKIPKPLDKPQPETVSVKEDLIAPEAKPSVHNTTAGSKVIQTENQTDLKPRLLNKTTFAIQIGVFSKKIEPYSKVFKGILPVREIIQDGKYKYICNESDSFKETSSKFVTVSKIFPDAFIVSVKDNHTRMVGDGHGKK
ncbi:MAG: N-acetylmuramoyl-L-alanine amidase [Prolixibacteraceae bacterium]